MLPPPAGVAVNVIASPVQAGFLSALIDTLAATLPDMVMVIALEVAGEPVAQPDELVITQVIASPLFKVDEVNVALLVPTFPPLTFH